MSVAETTSLDRERPEPAAQRPPACAAPTWIRQVTLTDFRCYGRAALSVDGRPVVLCGPNGAGKTNFLEALSFLAPGRGLRGAKLPEVARMAPGESENGRAWAVAAVLETPDGPRYLGTGRDPAQDSAKRERRVVKLDGVAMKGQQALGEAAALVWLTPQMDGLFRDGASARRRFLDRLVYGFDAAHAGRVAAYEQVLRERGRLLKSGAGDQGWLSALEESAAGHGVAIAAARRQFVARLAAACATGVGPFPRARLGLIGEVEAWLGEGAALETEERFRQQLAANRRADAESGTTVCGPHRSDLAVDDLERGVAAALSSTGEQKALLISIVLAHARLLAAERATTPILLLDEIVAHLDERRRGALFDELLALGCQAWLTGTDRALFEALGPAAQFLEVRAARIAALDETRSDWKSPQRS